MGPVSRPCVLARGEASKHMDVLRDRMNALVQATMVTRERNDLRPAIQMAASGRHSICSDGDESCMLVVPSRASPYLRPTRREV